jgi:predicted ATP-grasp superfamily ATP-dependent carboligase
MTRVLVYEYLAAGGRQQAAGNEDELSSLPAARCMPPASLWAEGWAMLSAAVADFRRVAGVQVRTILDARLQDEPAVMIAVAGWPDISIIWTDDEPAAFRAAAADADFALVVAPEFDRILETRCRWAIDAGAALLGPSPEAVALTADKLALARHFAARGVPTPETILWSHNTMDFVQPPCVVKPRFGAGSQHVCLLGEVGRDSYPVSFPDGLGNPSYQSNSDMIVQPFVPGRPASVSFLIGPRETIALMPAWQDISADGQFHYRGGSGPLPAELADRAARIARQAIDAVPGLAGYVGVDVILGAQSDHVIEINPRLTTSYVGLRALATDNLMDVLLRLMRGESVPKPLWRMGGVSWTTDGACTLGEPVA